MWPDNGINLNLMEGEYGYACPSELKQNTEINKANSAQGKMLIN